MAPAKPKRQPMVNGKRVRGAPSSNFGADRNIRPTCDLDLDILECPICIEPLSPPVYQCQNGHQLCSACRERILICPSCSQAIGNSRCLLAEKILDSLQVSCKYAAHGCKEMMKFSSREEHIKNKCDYRPCPCPFADCMYQGAKHGLLQHLEHYHDVDPIPFDLNASGRPEVKFIVQEPDMYPDDIFLLKDENQKTQLFLHLEFMENLGYMFFCTTFADYAVKYDLTVSLASNKKAYTMRVDASAQDIRQRENWKRDALLFYTGGSPSSIAVMLSLH